MQRASKVGQSVFQHFRDKLFAGAVILAPAVLTFFILRFLLLWFDRLLEPLERALFDTTIPGLGIVFLVALLYLAGLLVTYVLVPGGFRVLRPLVQWLPVVRELFSGIERLADFAVGKRMERFTSVVAVEYPWENRYTMAFATGETEIKGDKIYHDIYIATPMTGQSGIFAMMPEEQVLETNFRVEDYMVLISSAGLSYPEDTHIFLKESASSGPR